MQILKHIYVINTIPGTDVPGSYNAATDLSFDSDQFDVEHQIAVRRNVRRWARRTICHRRRNHQTAHAADFHTRHTLSPASNNAAKWECNRTAKIMAALENDAVFDQCACVMCGDRCTLWNDVASTFEHVNNL